MKYFCVKISTAPVLNPGLRGEKPWTIITLVIPNNYR